MTTVVDASALVAILRGEPERAKFLKAMSEADDLRLSVVNALEAMAKYVSPRGPSARRDVDELLADFEVIVEPVTIDLYERAVAAQLRFGWNTPAKLNLGDCFTYALAQSLDAPILFKGNDFSQTDLRSAL